MCVPCSTVQTSLSLAVSLFCLEGDQQEEALIFSEMSGSDLATRKRRRPPPRRIRSTALQQEVGWARQGSSYMKLSRDKESINQSKQSAGRRGRQLWVFNTIERWLVGLSLWISPKYRPMLLAQRATLPVPLVVCSDQTGSIHSQDAITDPQSAVGGSRAIRD